VAEAGLDDVFVDDITFPAKDGYLLGATLFLPRGAKRHAVLINSATALPRKIRNGFRRGSNNAVIAMTTLAHRYWTRHPRTNALAFAREVLA